MMQHLRYRAYKNKSKANFPIWIISKYLEEHSHSLSYVIDLLASFLSSVTCILSCQDLLHLPDLQTRA